jgi:hypothetical protein
VIRTLAYEASAGSSRADSDRTSPWLAEPPASSAIRARSGRSAGRSRPVRATDLRAIRALILARFAGLGVNGQVTRFACLEDRSCARAHPPDPARRTLVSSGFCKTRPRRDLERNRKRPTQLHHGATRATVAPMPSPIRPPGSPSTAIPGEPFDRRLSFEASLYPYTSAGWWRQSWVDGSQPRSLTCPPMRDHAIRRWPLWRPSVNRSMSSTTSPVGWRGPRTRSAARGAISRRACA